jgi:hypothetical protein
MTKIWMLALPIPLAIFFAAGARADDYGFLNEIDSVGIRHNITAADMVGLGQAVCHDFREGGSVYDIAAALTERRSPFTRYEAGEIIYAAVDQLCPGYKPAALNQARGTAQIA